MEIKSINKKIKELEKRISELEKHSYSIPFAPPIQVPSNPLQPAYKCSVCGSTSGCMHVICN